MFLQLAKPSLTPGVALPLRTLPFKALLHGCSYALWWLTFLTLAFGAFFVAVLAIAGEHP
jgi:hypothetical protein